MHLALQARAEVREIEMQHFDYVIIGAGPAGCVLAARLTEDPKVRVLLLEAGGSDRHPFIHIPAGYTKFNTHHFNWGMSTVPQKNLNNREVWYPQAKVLGGGSSINAMIYTRGARSDYDEWAALGCDNWGYDKVLPYFKKSEGNQRFADNYHGSDGPLTVSDPISPHPITRRLVQAVQQLGVPFTADFNGACQEGVGIHQTTTRNGRRASAAVTYLRPAMKRPNLVVKTGILVERILVKHGRATGVRYRAGSRTETVSINREVLLTSGAIGSPKLLMLSGIGPADHLRAVGIDVVHDLPGVGENFQDHLNFPVTAEAAGPYTYFGTDQWLRQSWWTLQYLLYRNGPLTTNVGEAGGFVRTSPHLDAPDIQIHLMSALVLPHGINRLAAYGVTVGSNVLRPRSRGTVRLRTGDPDDNPLIDPNFFSDPYDVEHGLAGIEFARQILKAPALAKILKKEIMPGSEVRTRDDLLAFARREGKMDYHPVGTCKMGIDEMAVVDQQLCVRGIEGLRVCDSSVMPTQISGNTNAPTIMIAERAAEFIASAS